MVVFNALGHAILLMPQSHCPESVPERAWIDHSSWFEWSFVAIRGHSSNDNDNDNPFEQHSSCACSQHEVFEHVQNVCVASTNKFYSRWYAWWACSYRVCLFVRIHFTRTECECDSIEKKKTESSSYYFRTIRVRFENDSHCHSHW